MAVIITPQTDIDDYFASDALGQSTLKTLIGGIDGYLINQNMSDEGPKKEYFIIGSGVDTILTGEEGEFEKQYYTSQIEKKPSDAEMAIVNTVFDELSDNSVSVDLSLAEYPEMLNLAIVEHVWYKGNPGEKRIAGLLERCDAYFEDLKLSYGKTIISREQSQTIHNIVMSLRTDDRTSKFFDREEQERSKSMDFYYQLPIYFIHKGVACKALMDLVIVKKDLDGNATSIIPVDLKTMAGNTLQFGDKIKKLRYDIQAAWYTGAVAAWAEQVFNKAVPVNKFMFIVESSTHQGTPLLYQVNQGMLDMGKDGRAKALNHSTEPPTLLSQEVVGYESLVDDYKFYESIDWTRDKRVPEDPHIPIIIGWNGIE
jgi:hypothetical protein